MVIWCDGHSHKQQSLESLGDKVLGTLVKDSKKKKIQKIGTKKQELLLG